MSLTHVLEPETCRSTWLMCVMIRDMTHVCHDTRHDSCVSLHMSWSPRLVGLHKHDATTQSRSWFPLETSHKDLDTTLPFLFSLYQHKQFSFFPCFCHVSDMCPGAWDYYEMGATFLKSTHLVARWRMHFWLLIAIFQSFFSVGKWGSYFST